MDHLCYLRFMFFMLSRLLIAALCSPAGKGLTYWLLLIFVVFVFNVQPTAKVIWRRDHGLKSHQTDW